MPATMTYEEAAAVPVGGLEALHFLRAAKVHGGDRVLIRGAGGTIGAFAVQLAKHFGAEVTAVDGAGKLDMLRSIGADRVIDYTQEDFTQNGQTYDVLFDVVGNSSLSRSVGSLSPNGRCLLANPGPFQALRGRWATRRSGKTVISGTSRATAEDLLFLKGLIEAGQLRTVIDRTYPLEETAEAHRYVESGQKAGNVIITVAKQETLGGDS